MWIVKADEVKGPYVKGYFPRKFRYKKEALKCAETARAHGSTNVKVEKGK